MLSADWLPHVPMKRLHWHWTAGGYMPGPDDLRAYHFLIDGSGTWHRGVPVERNSGTLRNGYAAHTLNANSDAIGIGMCGMAGAVETPFDPGRYPLKPAQFDALIVGSRVLASHYGIPIERTRTLFHCEVETSLGIRQRGKWDVARIPFMAELRGGLHIGDWVRSRIKGEAPVVAPAPIPAGGVGVVTAPTLNTRNAPNGTVTGALARGTRMVIVGMDLPWLHVRTPAGYEVWCHADHVDVIDGPPPLEPTKAAEVADPLVARLHALEYRVGALESRA